MPEGLLMRADLIMKEEDLISRFYTPDKRPMDDCLLVPGTDLLITTDSMAQGVHFRTDWSSPTQIAKKLVRSNVSDIASSGGNPRIALLNLGLPKDTKDEWIDEFSQAILETLKTYDCELMGGDTFRSEQIQLGMTVVAKRMKDVSRSNGRVGDTLYLTGSVGLSLLGYQILSAKLGEESQSYSFKNPIQTPHSAKRISGELRHEALARHLEGNCRLAWSREILTKEVHAMMDVSDGLIQDATRLASASGLSLEIDLDVIPCDLDGEQIMSPEEAIKSGEEFELLFLAKEDLSFSFPCVKIGQAIEFRNIANESNSMGGRIRFLSNGSVVSLTEKGFEHF